MNLVYIGDLINTHGIKGEVRIISEFEKKNLVFKVGNILKIFNTSLEITSYRTHKNYDMVTFKGIDSIEDVLKFKGEKVYIDRDLYDLGYLTTDLVGYDVFSDKYIGKISEIMDSPKNDILVVTNESHRSLIPYIKEFIKEVDFKNKKIIVNTIEGLLDED